MTANTAIVLIHGHGPKPEPSALLSLWRGALAAGLRRDRPKLLQAFEAAELSLVYYADLFEPPAANAVDPQLDLADRQRALEQLAALDKPKRFKRSSYEALPGKSSFREFLADVGSPVARGLGLGARAVTRWLPECGPYWQKDGVYAKACGARLRAELLPRLQAGQRVLLIAHGFGAVVAWDELWRFSREALLSPEQRLHSWLTLGAPLADDGVRRRLAGASERGVARYPACLTYWYNVAAEDDYVCHDETMANDFRAMLDQRLLSCIEDYLIYNLAVRFGRSNPHSSLGYLIHPKVTGLLADWLER